MAGWQRPTPKITLPGLPGGSTPVDRARQSSPYIAVPSQIPRSVKPLVPPTYIGGGSYPSGEEFGPPSGGELPTWDVPSNAYNDNIWYGGSTNFSGSTANTGELDSLRAERLAAALKAIGAQFDYEEGDLESQQAELIEQFRSGMLANTRLGELTQESVGDAAAERGLNRSGLYIKELGRAMAPIGDERADLVRRLNPAEGVDNREAGNAGTEVRAIEALIKLLGQQESAAVTGAELESRQDELSIDQLIAMIGGNLNG